MSDDAKFDVVSSLAAERYALLADYVVLHISPSYGYLKHANSGWSVLISRETKDLLLRCDGTMRVRDILTERLRTCPSAEAQLLLAMVELVNLVNWGFLELHSEARPIAPILTGDPKIYFPLNLQVELTAACNLRCFYCYREAEARHREDRLTTDELLDILNALLRHGLQSVELTGGEPMMHKDFDEILQFCLEKFAHVGILTNGTRLSEQRIAAMLPFQHKLVFSISLDGSNHEIHDRRRGVPGAFSKTTKGVRRLTEAGFRTRVSMVVDETNWDDVERTLLLARSLGANMFAYTPLLPIGRGKEHYRRWEGHDPFTVYRQDSELRRKYAEFIHVLPEESLFDLQDPGGCGAGYRTYAMDPMGRIRPCVTFDPHVAIFGSLRTHTPSEVFGNPLANAFAELTPPQGDVCGRCAFRVFCQGCELRGTIASQWLAEGECVWLQQPATSSWATLVQQHTMAPG